MDTLKKYFKSTLATVATIAGLVGMWAEQALSIIEKVRAMWG